MAIRQLVGRPVRALLRRFGYELHRPAAAVTTYPIDYDEGAIALYERVRPYTLTSHERVVALRDAVRHVVANDVPGAFVECGVWKGGSALVMVETLLAMGVTDRDVHLYDTFTHMPPPGPEDHLVDGRWSGEDYEQFLANPFYANDSVHTVRALLEATGYPAARLHLVAGMVEETLPACAPEAVALCRLDTDLYASTRHELEHLGHRLSEGAVLIVDDYGHFLGAKQAVDEYFAAAGASPLLIRVDFTGRVVVVGPALRACLALRP